MNKSDKDKLLILLVIVLYIAMTVFFIRGTKKKQRQKMWTV